MRVAVPEPIAHVLRHRRVARVTASASAAAAVALIALAEQNMATQSLAAL